MKAQLKLIILLFFTYSVCAQNELIYLNDDLIEITKEEYNKPSELHYYLDFQKNDTLFKVKAKRGVKKGQLSSKDFNMLKKELFALSNRTIGPKSKIIINYYHGRDKCNSSGNRFMVGRKYRAFAQKTKRRKRIEQFFMFKSNQGLKYYGKGIDWIEDENQMISSLFFPINYPCGSYAVIDKRGNYSVYRGEYNIERIFENL